MDNPNSYIRAAVYSATFNCAKDIIITLMSQNITKSECHEEAIKGLRDAASDLEKLINNGK